MAGIVINKLHGFVDIAVRSLDEAYAKYDESAKPKKTPKILGYSNGISRKVVARCYKQLRKIFEETYIFIPETFNLTLIRNVNPDIAITYEKEIKKFHEKYVLPMEDENTKLNEIQYIFIAASIVILIMFEDFFKAMFLNDSSVDKITPQTEYKELNQLIGGDSYMNPTISLIRLWLPRIMNIIEKEYSKANSYQENYWETIIGVKLIDAEINKRIDEEGYFCDHLDVLDEKDRVIDTVKFPKYTYWNAVSKTFSQIFYQGVMKHYEDRITYNEYEEKLDKISDILSKLPYNIKMKKISKHTQFIDSFHDECLKEVKILREKDTYTYQLYKEKSARRLTAAETEKYWRNREVKKIFAGKLDNKLRKRFDRITNAETEEEKERLIKELVYQINYIMLLL